MLRGFGEDAQEESVEEMKAMEQSDAGGYQHVYLYLLLLPCISYMCPFLCPTFFSPSLSSTAILARFREGNYGGLGGSENEDGEKQPYYFKVM